MPYDARAIANYFLQLAKRDELQLDPLKIQKLVYIAHGWNLAIKDQPLVKERVEAWAYGPVIPSIYSAFRTYGNGPIRKPVEDYHIPEDSWFSLGGEVRPLSITDGPNAAENEFTGNLLEKVWNPYRDFTGIQLSNMTHEPGTPWQAAWNESKGQRGAVIKDELIRQYFLNQVKQHNAAQV